MAIANGTYLENLVNPQVMADMIDKKLFDYIRFAPLATVDYTLQGRPGDTITLPSFNLLASQAEVVGEGEAIPIYTLTASTTSATVRKVGIGVKITDESVLSGYGDPFGEAVDQELMAIAAAVDNDFLGILGSISSAMTFTASASTIAADDVNNALELFGEDIDGIKVAVVPPAVHTKLRNAKDWVPASEIAAGMVIRGAVGEAYGCQIVVSNKLKASGKVFVVKPGALRLFLKRDTMVETARDIEHKATIATADKHYVAYLYDQSKAIAIKPHA